TGCAGATRPLGPGGRVATAARPPHAGPRRPGTARPGTPPAEPGPGRAPGQTAPRRAGGRVRPSGFSHGRPGFGLPPLPLSPDQSAPFFRGGACLFTAFRPTIHGRGCWHGESRMATPATALESSQLWAASVAGQADFPDERLNSRFALILQTLADKPLDSF